MPEKLAYWRGPELELALYPSDLLVRGKKTKLAWSRGVLAEGLARGPGLRRVWAILDQQPEQHRDSKLLTSRVREMTEDLGRLAIPYDDWQVLYREIAQLERALHGEAQLLDSVLVEGRPPHKPSLVQRFLSP